MARERIPSTQRAVGGPVGLRRLLALWFGLTFIAVLAANTAALVWGIPYVHPGGIAAEARHAAFDHLDLAADLKKAALMAWVDERHGDAEVLAASVVVQDYVTRVARLEQADRTLRGDRDRLLLAARRLEGSAAVARHLACVAETYRAYSSVELVDAITGTVLSASDPDAVGSDVSATPYFVAARAPGRTFTCTVGYDAQQAAASLIMAKPVIEAGSSSAVWSPPLGVLILRAPIERIDAHMLPEGGSLGATGEVVLVDAQRRVLAPLAHPMADGSLAQVLRTVDPGGPAGLAAHGAECLFESQDYRGTPVLAAVRHIKVTPAFGFGMVVKQDLAEVYAPVRREVAYALGLAVAAAGLVALFTVRLANAISRPVRALSKAASDLAEGASDAAPVDGPREIRLLAAAFNEMAARVRQKRDELEQAVRERTEELSTANVRLAGEVAERSRVANELEQRSNELERANAELERFVYSASHDLKSPLITMKGFVGTLEQDAVSGNIERFRADVMRIVRATNDMEELLDDLLSVSRSGRPAGPPQTVLFGDLVAQAVARLGAQIAESDAAIIVQPGLPFVFGDRVRLVTVIQNLIANALKFSRKDERPRVEVGAEAREGETVFLVRDNGIGIEPEYHGRVFGLFEKLERITEGTGVGLAVAKRVIEDHGGRVWVESEGRDAGTTVCLVLPGRDGGGQ